VPATNSHFLILISFSGSSFWLQDRIWTDSNYLILVLFCFQVHASRLAFNLESFPFSGDDHHDRLQPICFAFDEFSFSDSDFFFQVRVSGFNRESGRILII
jgi:hypothetical protein